MIEASIREYIETEILPRYSAFDKAHQADHVNMVISQSLDLASRLQDIDANMAYVIAAYHDLGLINGRENHHKDSRIILENDPVLKRHFSTEQIRVMGEAVEDHRASKSGKPRSIYGLIVAEADRCINCESIIRRTIQYGLGNFPDFTKEEQFLRTTDHLNKKYGPDGYLKVWLPCSDNAQRLQELRSVISNPEVIREVFERIYDEETVNRHD
ncbi:MAG: HD domain-containing protein [Bacteroidales bacterium]|nr:HD domain-containing protein [Bacteroidales bacterium]